MERIKNWKLLLLCFVLFLGSAGCSKEEPKLPKPEKEVIRNIARLSTIDAYFHNVVKCEKPAGEGIWNWGQTDRKYWFEYTGNADYGIDMHKVKIDVKDNSYHITIPGAEVTSISINEDTINKDSVITNKDNWWNQNPITSKDVTNAIADAQKEMELSAWQNKSLLESAQKRAADLIKGYIQTMGAAAGITYDVDFEYEDNSIPEDIQKEIDKLKEEK